jgi:tRNA threonylcarbamoyladenosine biosynthesis protein TsaE
LIRLHTASVEETRRVAGRLAEVLTAGDLILLVGDLGAGKTAFVQGLAAALDVQEPVTSPTFTLAHRYQGNGLRVHHLDVYRLESPDEAIDLGLAELLDDEAVTVVEWGDRLRPALPAELLEISFHFGEGDDDREIRLQPHGRRWERRLDGLGAAPC